MSEIELKPCPFCGGPARTLPALTTVYCDTPNCGANQRCDTQEYAIKMWNTRSQSERVSRLEEALKAVELLIAAYGSYQENRDSALRIIRSALNQSAEAPQAQWRKEMAEALPGARARSAEQRARMGDE